MGCVTHGPSQRVQLQPLGQLDGKAETQVPIGVAWCYGQALSASILNYVQPRKMIFRTFAYIRLYLCKYFAVFHNEKMALIAPYSLSACK